MILREERIQDEAAVYDLLNKAFGQPDEGDLVRQLWADGAILVSLVAEIEGEVVGYILFSRLPIEREDGTSVAAVALGPMAVLPERQGSGIGKALVEKGLELCRVRDVEAVIVLGHPDYYPRFGFSAALARELDAPFSGPAFMAMEFKDGVLSEGGEVRYASAFGL